jgi:hypothetical protein
MVFSKKSSSRKLNNNKNNNNKFAKLTNFSSNTSDHKKIINNVETSAMSPILSVNNKIYELGLHAPLKLDYSNSKIIFFNNNRINKNVQVKVKKLKTKLPIFFGNNSDLTNKFENNNLGLTIINKLLIKKNNNNKNENIDNFDKIFESNYLLKDQNDNNDKDILKPELKNMEINSQNTRTSQLKNEIFNLFQKED